MVYVRRAIVLMLLAGLPSTAAAAPREVRLRDYLHTTWSQYDGVPFGVIDKILQTPDGYLWILTSGALLRFDGIRFVPTSTPCTQPILSVASALDGGFWALCGEKLIRRTADARFLTVSQTLPTPPARHTLFADRQGRVWILGRTIRYLKPDGTFGRAFDRPEAPLVFTAAQDSEGTIWATDGGNLFHLHGDRVDFVAAMGTSRCLTPAHTGGVLVSSGTSILQLRNGAQPSIVASSPELRVYSPAQYTLAPESCFREAEDGSLWIPKDQKSIARVRQGRIEVPAGIGPLDRVVTTIFIDREGIIWVGTTGDLHRFRKPTIQFVNLPPDRATPSFIYLDSHSILWTGSGAAGVRGLNLKDGTEQTLVPKAAYDAIGEDERGTIWLSTPKAIGHVVNGTFVAVADATGKPIAHVTAFEQDQGGYLWALAAGVGIYRVTPDSPRLVIASPGASRPFLASERSGIWVAVAGGGLEQHVDGSTKLFPALNPAPGDGSLLAMLEDGDSIWTGSSTGLHRLRNGKWTTWTHEQGLTDGGGVRGMVADHSGHLWLVNGAGGLLRLSRAQLAATPDGRPQPLSFVRIPALNGIVPYQAKQAPSVSADRNGRLYGFATPADISIIDPDAVTEPSMIPPIVLESVVVDRQPVDHTSTNRFIEPTQLQFEYTALNFRSPEYMRFRYRLDGYDAGWIEPRAGRRATYGPLRPGAYRFRVIAEGSEGVWNDSGASFAFQIVPPFWRTWWFQLSIVAFGLSIVGGVYRLRVRSLTRQFNQTLDARVDERTRIARELHDTLLQSFQGVMLRFQSARDLLPADPARAAEALDGALGRADQAFAEGRDAIQHLRSSTIGSDELAQSIASLAEELANGRQGEGPPMFHISVEGSPRDLYPTVRDEIDRIAREALRNAFHHAEADHIEAEVTYGAREIRLRIRDDGKGIDPTYLTAGRARHWGLAGMRERAERIGARLNLWSEVGAGTEVELCVPAPAAYTAPAGRDGVFRLSRKPGSRT